MHPHFSNHQLYLAEKCIWLDRQTLKNSKRALMKIESLRLIIRAREDEQQVQLIRQLLNESLLHFVDAQEVLHSEGFYLYDLRS